jgi:hypothetical protein
MSVIALLEYFEPLSQWLSEANARHGMSCGWNSTGLSSLLSHGGNYTHTSGAFTSTKVWSWHELHRSLWFLMAIIAIAKYVMF